MAEYDKKGDKLPKDQRKNTKWTSSAISAGKYEGWGDYGIPMYNDLVKKIRADRLHNKDFDDRYLANKKKEHLLKLSGRKRGREGSQQDHVEIENDMEFLGHLDLEEVGDQRSI